MHLPVGLAFIDTISGEYEIKNLDWERQVWDKFRIEFYNKIGRQSGRIKFTFDDKSKRVFKDTIEWNFWEITLHETLNKNTGEVRVFLKITGNPSKIFHRGENIRCIGLNDCLKIVKQLCATFLLDVNEIIITAPTEVTITPEPSHPVTEADIKNRFVFPNTLKVETVKADKTGDFMGYEGGYSHYDDKVYLPAIKFVDDSLNIIRVERHFKKIQTFKERTKINTWGELFTNEGMLQCGLLLLDYWKNLIVIDPGLRVSNKKYSLIINEMIKEGKCKKYWLNKFPEYATDKTRKKRLMEYNEIAFQKGDGLHKKIENIIRMEIEKFRNITTWLTGNIPEITIKDCTIENRLLNNNTTMKSTEDVKKKLIKSSSKREIERERRYVSRYQYERFMIALSKTIKAMEK